MENKVDMDETPGLKDLLLLVLGLNAFIATVIYRYGLRETFDGFVEALLEASTR